MTIPSPARERARGEGDGSGRVGDPGWDRVEGKKWAVWVGTGHCRAFCGVQVFSVILFVSCALNKEILEKISLKPSLGNSLGVGRGGRTGDRGENYLVHYLSIGYRRP